MISVTGQYLVNIIERHLNKTITRRRSYTTPELIGTLGIASNEEIVDFILSIPYFDNGLKDFIFGNTNEQTIIVSQSWEIAFIVQTRKWAESDEWLNDTFKPTKFFYNDLVKTGADFLKLPY